MPYRVAAKVNFTDVYNRMTADEQMAEQVAGYETIAKNGGTVEAQYVLWSDRCVILFISYPDQQSAYRSEMQVAMRGSFDIHSQAALTADEALALGTEARAAATVKV
jgi:uncharacterized protein with GYD domain